MEKEIKELPMRINNKPYKENRFKGKEGDDMCIFCLTMCSKNSNCGDKYFLIQGSYNNSIEDNMIDTFGCCDKCFVGFEHLHFKYTLIFKFEDAPAFYVDNYYREETF